jgi:hypothetical protein
MLRTSTDPEAEFKRRSNRNIRVWVGIMAFTLPTVLFLIDFLFLTRSVSFRGSLSAYYHSPARDWFVANLFVSGIMLVTYFWSVKRTLSFWLSMVAGLAVIGVAFLPTWRPDPEVTALTQLQAAFGEGDVARVHQICAAIFILSLGSICLFIFAKEEENAGFALLHRACGVVIFVAVAWVLIGDLLNVEILGWTPLYVGEVVSVYAFAVSWLAMERRVLSPFRRIDNPPGGAPSSGGRRPQGT